MKMDLRRVLILPLLLFSYSAVADWHWANPKPQGNIIADATFANGQFVAVGNSGTILTSPDGVVWTMRNSNSNAWLEAITWTGTQYVAVGNGGAILTSPDGAVWTPQVSGSSAHLYALAQNGSLIVAVGSDGAVLTSTDAVHWSRHGTNTLDWLNGIVWQGGRFVAVGQHGSIFTSTDGATWTLQNSGVRTATGDGPSLESIAFGANTFVVVGQGGTVLTSADGVTWVPTQQGDALLNSVYWDGNRFLVVGTGGTLLTSADGRQWTAGSTGTSDSFETVTSGNGYIIAGNHGAILSGPDGVSWTSRVTNIADTQLNGVARNGNAYVAVGRNGTILTASSTSGSPAVHNPVNSNLNATTFVGNTGYVAVGDKGVVLASPDGQTWTPQTSNTGNSLFGVAASASSVVAVGDGGTIIYAAPGSTQWTAAVPGVTTALRAVTWDSSTGFTAVGDGGVVLRSTDNGATWVQQSSGTTVNLLGVASSPHTTVAVGENGTLLVNGGPGWQLVNTMVRSSLEAVAWDGQRFTGVGASGTIITSADGMTWAPQSGTGNDLFGITARSDGELMAVGEGGTVIYSSCPCATDDTASTLVDTPVTINVLANDFPKGVQVIAVDTASNHGGAMRINGDGTVTYTPPSGFSGTDVFNYTISDGTNQDIGTVVVSVGDPGGVAGKSGGGGGGAADFTLLFALPFLYRRGRKKPG